MSFVLFVDAFGISLVELDSSLYITVRIGGPNVTAALPIGCDEESFTLPNSFYIEFRNLSEYFVFAVRFLNCVSTIFLRLHYKFSFSLLANLSFFDIILDWVCYKSHKTGSLYVYQFNPIENQIKDKDICLRRFYAKIFKLKIMLVLAFVLMS